MEATKKCAGCGRILPLSEFNKNKNRRDGLQERCRECFSEYNRERYRKDPERFKENTKKNRLEHPEKELETRLKTFSKHPSKIAARRLIDVAIRAGVLAKPERCQGCGCSNDEHRIEAHHSDYTKPLDVIWLCTQCHRQMDARRREHEGKTPHGARG